MAEIVENKQGFKVVKLSGIEALSAFNSVGICDSCNYAAPRVGYYIAVLNSYYCKSCYHDFLERSYRLELNRAAENRNFKKIIKKLGLRE